MTLRHAIETTFFGRAFCRPLFYAYPDGLRFELSEGETAIGLFLSAHRKASEICADIFDRQEKLTVCLHGYHFDETRFSYRQKLRSLSAAGIDIPALREIWQTEVDEEGVSSVFLAFEAPVDRLPNLLWCALASDFGSIKPNPGCSWYLFNLEKGLLVHPYDDRGMDVVGPNRDLLAMLYRKHGTYLLDYDRPAMRRSFEDEA
ncbi:MAG: DUF3885 domain-containing protein [Xanthomonadaceae bacterium]|nr:DUF3885 domain-containing protein [Xanthomonadaceae bacterium]